MIIEGEKILVCDPTKKHRVANIIVMNKPYYVRLENENGGINR